MPILAWGRRAPGTEEGHPPPVVFIDGACPLCQRAARFLVDRDRSGVLRFAHLQGSLAERMLPAELRDVGLEGSVVLLEPAAGNRVSVRSEAILRCLAYLPPPWHWVGRLAGVDALRRLLDAGYRFAVRRRHAWLGPQEACPLPDERLRARFLG